MSKLLIWLTAGIVCSSAMLLAAGSWMRTPSKIVSHSPGVFVCRETGKFFTGPQEQGQQLHPDTGRASLWPAVYCPQCQAWKAAPPIERLYGQPELMNCPKCKTRRSFDGEVPADARPL